MTTSLVRMFSPAPFRIIPLLIALFTIIPTIAPANDKAGTAYEFVQEWTRTYGVNHNRAAEMMTPKHRGGMPEAEWVELYGAYLEYAKYKHLGGELVSEQEDAHKARIILKSTVDSINGPVVQHEIYDLVKGEDGWLVDSIDIRDENFGAAVGPAPTKPSNSNNKPSPEHTP